MKYYIASSFKNIELVHAVAHGLNQKGCDNTYDWTRSQAADLEDLQAIGLREEKAVTNSDVFILILPAGKGANTELGLALAMKKDIYLYATNSDVWDVDKTSTFYHLPNVKIVDSDMSTLISKILEVH
ncbi:MAG TPA: group-specific protein [Lactobacillus sp.]|nr:group-specific protein [Lactobacillus sp.]